MTSEQQSKIMRARMDIVKELQECLGAVHETLNEQQDDPSEYGKGDWRDLVESISQNGFNWSELVKSTAVESLSSTF